MTETTAITWEQKTEFCSEKFDPQAWDMFVTGVEINPVDFKKYADVMALIKPQLEKEVKRSFYGFRAAYRMEIILSMIEEPQPSEA